MGYRKPAHTYLLQFEDPGMAGLEVRAKGANVRQLMDMMGLAELERRDFTSAQIEGMFDLFAKRLISWNLEDEDGKPVPATLAGLLDQEMAFAQSIVLAWMDAITGVPAPLDGSSTAGEQFPEGSIPMEALSPSLVS